MATPPIVQAAKTLSKAVGQMRFGPPVTHVYNPLSYAWSPHQAYLLKFGEGKKRVLFLGMNPGPFGMAQTGVPFGEVSAVRDWLGVEAKVTSVDACHPKRPIQGFDCLRSEVSGRRLWGLFARRFGSAERFFADHFVANYCPLLFVEASGANRTPDKLPSSETGPLLEACDTHLRSLLEILQPTWVIGIGKYAENRARKASEKYSVQIGTVLHPSPASPASNKNWEGTATRQLQELGIWE